MTFAARRCAAALRPTWRPNNWPARKSPRAAIFMRSGWCCMKCSRASERSPKSPATRSAPEPITRPSRPSSVVKDLDPIVEKVILRCLETEPASRPPTALAVAAALPGGDPLAAALAAGETPSPQLVAASGETVGLRPRVAVVCLAAVLLGVRARHLSSAAITARSKRCDWN